MTRFHCSLLAATVGLWLAQALPASAQGPPSPTEPARLDAAVHSAAPVSVNQRLAEAIADSLRGSGQLRRFRIDISVQEGIAELTGQVTNQTQRDEALRLVMGVPGVRSVRDRLTLSENIVLPAIAQQPSPLSKKEVAAAPLLPVPPGGFQEPVPIFQAPPGGAAMGGQFQQPPPMPPYAWPTYAPYNNYSRVGYPTQLPHSAWPFIGPQYPFPKVPLGWRSVHLTYSDGHWWYGKSATGHDWWRIRYW